MRGDITESHTEPKAGQHFFIFVSTFLRSGVAKFNIFYPPNNIEQQGVVSEMGMFRQPCILASAARFKAGIPVSYRFVYWWGLGPRAVLIQTRAS
jgi:hypothetical protein